MKGRATLLMAGLKKPAIPLRLVMLLGNQANH